MSILVSICLFILGGGLLYFGGTQIVEGSVRIAKKLNIPTIVIGLTVVAMGTSMPELFVSMSAALKGSSSIALGNVIGSNIFNIVFVLGISCFFMPLKANKSSFNYSMITMFSMYTLLLIMIFNKNNASKGFLALFQGGRISSLDGLILFIALIIYIILLKKIASRNKEEASILEKQVAEVEKTEPIAISITRLVISIVSLAFGSEFFINGSVGIFSKFISEHIIGVIIVAVGTSIPELVTSIIAASKKEADISVGNIIGSNIFNVGAVLGISAMSGFKFGGISLAPTNSYAIDLGVMILSALLLFVFMSPTRPLKKSAGLVFLALYIIYVAVLIKGVTI